VLARAAIFVVPASALIALLPIVAADELGLGATGYGLLQAAFGLGAIVAASALPRLRHELSLDVLAASASVVLGAVTVAVAFVDVAAVVGLVLVAGGLAWLLVLSSLNVSAQDSVPDWVRGRGLALYMLLFMGGTAAGSALWGALAEATSTRIALAAAAALLVAGVAAAPRFRLALSERLDLRRSLHWPEPALVVESATAQGPVLVTVEYRVAPERAAEFAEIMKAVGRMRRRTGARAWGLYRDAATDERLVETFVVESWQEHLRQHDRITESDRRLEQRRNALLRPGTTPEIRHLLWAYVGARPKEPPAAN
jgi:MFS family permease